MKHLFLPYELAVIAKQKLFAEKCMGYFSLKEQYQSCTDEEFDKFTSSHFELTINFPYNDAEGCTNNPVTNDVVAPLYQQIVDWFRVEHDILFVPIACGSSSKVLGYKWFVQIGMQDDIYGTKMSDYYIGLNDAIKEAFKLI